MHLPAGASSHRRSRSTTTTTTTSSSSSCNTAYAGATCRASQPATAALRRVVPPASLAQHALMHGRPTDAAAAASSWHWTTLIYLRRQRHRRHQQHEADRKREATLLLEAAVNTIDHRPPPQHVTVSATLAATLSLSLCVCVCVSINDETNASIISQTAVTCIPIISRRNSATACDI